MSIAAKQSLYKIVRYVVLFVVGIVFIIPLVWLLSNSFKTFDQIVQFPPVLIPQPSITTNYTALLTAVIQTMFQFQLLFKIQ